MGGEDAGDASGEEDGEEEASCGDSQALSWIASHGADAAKVADGLGVTEAELLGLSSLESGWGAGPYVVAVTRQNGTISGVRP